jgi:hypothetical protein
MTFDIRQLVGGELRSQLPETPHELPVNRARIDELLVRVREGESVDLLQEFLNVVDWRESFTDEEGKPLMLEDIARLHAYYRRKFQDVGPLYLAELLSTEFMTEQRARGDIVFSDRLIELGNHDQELWQEIRHFFRRKEMVTALLAMAHASRRAGRAVSDIEESDQPPA